MFSEIRIREECRSMERNNLQVCGVGGARRITIISHTPAAAAPFREPPKWQYVLQMNATCCFGEKRNSCAWPYYNCTAVQGSAQDPLNSLKRCRCVSGVCKLSKSIFKHVRVSYMMNGIYFRYKMHRLSRFTYFYLRPPPEKNKRTK